jgi:hypothetical protein
VCILGVKFDNIFIMKRSDMHKFASNTKIFLEVGSRESALEFYVNGLISGNKDSYQKMLSLAHCIERKSSEYFCLT